MNEKQWLGEENELGLSIWKNKYQYEAILSLEDYANVESELQSAGCPLTDLNKFKYNTKTTKYIEKVKFLCYNYLQLIKHIKRGENDEKI